MVAASAAGLLVLLGAFPAQGWSWLALALSTTAMGVVQPLLRDRGPLPAGYAQALVSSAGVGEVLPTILLSLVVARADQIANQVLMILAFSGLCALLLGLAIHYRHRWEDFLERTMHDSAQLPIRLAMGLLVLMVVIGNLVQINLVLGALVTGVLLRYGTNASQRQALADRLDELTRTACRLAREARAANARPDVRIAGSLAPLDTTYEAGVGDGFVDQPLPHVGDVTDIANAVLYLASDESRFMTGAELKLDGGISAM